jgi:hypothetical protein
MIYYTTEARMSARKNILDLGYKLAVLKPTDDFTYSDISNLIHVLMTFDDALVSEQNKYDNQNRK